MRHFSLITLSLLGVLTLAACPAGDDEADTMADTTTGPDGDGDGDGDPGDGDGEPGDGDGDTGECFEQPAICAQFVRCVAALAPDSAMTVEEQYGADGSCWCGTDAEANECYNTCISQVADALEGFPTEAECHESVCYLEDLDPTQPYGPIMNGSCPDYTSAQDEMIPQMPIMNPIGVPGGFCSPQCSGLANYCPEHTQTSAQGTCYLVLGQDNYCITRCYVDSTIVGGTQCQCGATCQPQGAPDGEGNMRGICTFE